MVTVRTTWPGRSPEEIEESILVEQEEKLKTIQGLYKMTSTAELGRGRSRWSSTSGSTCRARCRRWPNKLDEVPPIPTTWTGR